MAEVIYKANFSKKTATDIIEPTDLSLYDSKTEEFINLSIAYAKKSKSDIIILKNMNDIKVKIYITIGMFFGNFKKAFLEFAGKSRDFLILPVFGNSNFTLEISANYDMIGENE